MAAECPRCGNDDGDRFIKNANVKWNLGGSWGCVDCGYIKGRDNHSGEVRER